MKTRATDHKQVQVQNPVILFTYNVTENEKLYPKTNRTSSIKMYSKSKGSYFFI